MFQEKISNKLDEVKKLLSDVDELGQLAWDANEDINIATVIKQMNEIDDRISWVANIMEIERGYNRKWRKK